MSVAPSFAQSTGTLRMLIDPGNDFSFIVDQKHRMQQREVKLSEGLHNFTIWAPARMVVDTSVFVIADRTSDLVIRLAFSPEYKTYRSELSRFSTKKRWTKAAPILAMTGGLVWTGIAYGQLSKAHKALEADQANYDINVDPGSISTLKGTTIPADKEAFKEARNKLYMASAFTALSGAATWYFLKRTNGWAVPVFEDKEKVRFDGLSWFPGEGSGLFMAGLTLHLGQ